MTEESKESHPPRGITPAQRQFLAVTAALALVFTVGGALLLDSGRRSENPQETQALSAQDPQASHAYKNATGSYLSGKMAASRGEIKTALRYLGEAMAYQSDNRELLAEAYRLNLLAGNVDAAGGYARKMGGERPADNRLISPDLLEAVLAVKQSNYALAREKLARLEPSGVVSLFLPVINAWVSVGQRAPVSAELLEQGIRFAGQFDPVVRYQVARVLEAAGMTRQAGAQYERLAARGELSYRVAVALAGFYRRQGEEKKRELLEENYRRQFGHELAEDGNAAAVATPREGLAEVFYGIAGVLYGIEAYAEAEVPLKLALDLRPDFDAAQLLQANLLEKQDRFDEAYRAYEALAGHPAFGLQASIRMAYCLHDSGKPKKALALLKKIQARYPGEPEPALTIADVLRVEGKYHRAIAQYTRALEAGAGEGTKRWPVLYSRGICYERSGQWPQAEADFLEALRLEPDQPDVLNYLGYSWLIQNKHLDQARGMLEKAMAARPQDAHIIDSMGWAMYQLGRYEEALEHLERAVDLSPRDPTINEHLGDVYWRLGYRIQAKYQWEKALFFEPEEPGQKEAIRTKISEGLPPRTEKKPEMLTQNSAVRAVAE